MSTHRLRETIVIHYIDKHYAFPLENGQYSVETPDVGRCRRIETIVNSIEEIKETVQKHTLIKRPPDSIGDTFASVQELEELYPWDAYAKTSSALDVLNDIQDRRSNTTPQSQ